MNEVFVTLAVGAMEVDPLVVKAVVLFPGLVLRVLNVVKLPGGLTTVV